MHRIASVSLLLLASAAARAGDERPDRRAFAPPPGMVCEYSVRRTGLGETPREGKVAVLRPSGEAGRTAVVLIEAKGASPADTVALTPVSWGAPILGDPLNDGIPGNVRGLLFASLEAPRFEAGARWTETRSRFFDGLGWVEGAIERRIEAGDAPGALRIVSERIEEDPGPGPEAGVRTEWRKEMLVDVASGRPLLARAAHGRTGRSRSRVECEVRETSHRALTAEEEKALAAGTPRLEEILEAARSKLAGGKPPGAIGRLLGARRPKDPFALIEAFRKDSPSGLLSDAAGRLGSHVEAILAGRRKEAEKRREEAKARVAAAFALKDLDGKELSLGHLKGKPVVLCFLGIEEPRAHSISILLGEWRERYGPRGVAVVAIDVDDEAEDVRAFARERELVFPILLGGDEVAGKYGVDANPTTFVIDRSGKIVLREDGYRSGTTDRSVERAIEALLRESS